MQKSVSVSQPTFDYEGFDAETRRQLESEAAAIRKNLLQVKTSAIQLGQRLLKVKALLPRRFGEWVGSHCDFSPRTAELFMRAAEFADGHASIAEKVSQTALFQLSAPRLDENLRRRLVDAVESGEAVSSAQIKKLIHRESAKPNASEEADVNEGYQTPQAFLEIASILIGGLAEPDLERVRSILASLDNEPIANLAVALTARDLL